MASCHQLRGTGEKELFKIDLSISKRKCKKILGSFHQVLEENTEKKKKDLSCKRKEV